MTTEATADRIDDTSYPDISRLLQPLQIGSLWLKNRIVMPGMQRAWCVDCAPSDKLIEYYRRRALGGTALVITEACAPDHWSGSSNPMFAKLNPRTRDAWRDCVDAVHEAGGKIFLQIWHQGSRDMKDAPPGFEGLSPSGLITKDLPNGRPATLRELGEIKDAFAQSAAVVREIGADGVEVHACHGYFLDEFLWSEINLRTDKYGGPTIADRATYPAEVVAAVRAAVGPDFPISVRLSQWKEEDFDAKVVTTPEELRELLAILRAAGADLFHVSTRRFWTPEWPGDDRGLAGWAKSLTDVPVIAVGSIGLDVDVMATLEGVRDQADRPRPDLGPDAALRARRLRPGRRRPQPDRRRRVGHQDERGPRRRDPPVRPRRPGLAHVAARPAAPGGQPARGASRSGRISAVSRCGSRRCPAGSSRANPACRICSVSPCDTSRMSRPLCRRSRSADERGYPVEHGGGGLRPAGRGTVGLVGRPDGRVRRPPGRRRSRRRTARAARVR